MAVASTLRRLADPAAPSPIVTVPEDTVWLAEVELVKVAKVPRPAMLAVAPRTATVSSSFRPRQCRRRTPAFRSGVRGARQVIRRCFVTHMGHRQLGD